MKKLIVLLMLLFSVFSVHSEILEIKAVSDKTIDSVHIDNDNNVKVDNTVLIDVDAVKSITGDNKNNLVSIETDSLSVMSVDSNSGPLAYFSDSNMKKSNYTTHKTNFIEVSTNVGVLTLGGGPFSGYKRRNIVL